MQLFYLLKPLANMDNKLKLLLIVCSAISINSRAQNASGFIINYIPKYNYSHLVKGGTVPAAINLRRFYGGESLGIGYSKKINNRLSVSFNTYFEIDNYRCDFNRDYTASEKKWVQRHNITVITAVQPLMIVSWRDFKSKFLNRYYINAGISYNFNNPPYDLISYHWSHKEADSFYWKSTVTDIKTSNFALHLELGKAYKISKNADFEIGLRVKLGQSRKIVKHELYTNTKIYNFETVLSPSYIGISGRLYLHRKAKI